jgi:oxygen-independent coproporphyrinogen-3 oxidase
LEANPGTVDQQRFADFRQLGINRLSIGVQSFDEACLRRLGRIHDGQQAYRAVDAAVNAGFENFNIDLMFGLPGQSLALAAADIKQAIALKPTHISYYQLTLEPNTLFANNPPALPDEDTCWQMQMQGITQLSAAGYDRYEVSAFAQPDRQCWHNLNYWRYGDYLGIGAGAHAKITDPQTQQIIRLSKIKHPKEYILSSKRKIATETIVNSTDRPFEFMMNALRLSSGVESALFSERTGLPITTASAALQRAQERGWITWDHQRIAPTPEGMTFLNDLLTWFLPESPRKNKNMVDEHKLDCPYCGEAFTAIVDRSAGSQEYIEDCPVCCKAIDVTVQLDHTGNLISLWAKREDE